MQRPLAAVRVIGPGAGDHASPDSSSRMNNASAVGSTIGSLANEVRRFSRLFSDQVVAEPDAVMMVPKQGLAITFAHGSGVSWSPSSTIVYARPSSVNPPRPFVSVIDGSAIGWSMAGETAGSATASGKSGR